MILEEDVYDWFEIEPPLGLSPFMLRVLRFRPEMAAMVPAVVHVDGTGRVQTISRAASPALHHLVASFKEKTGIPILLNTSFNIAGEPLVETPDDALWCFMYTDMDVCVLGDWLVMKEQGIRDILDHSLSLNTESVIIHSDKTKEGVTLEIKAANEASDSVLSSHVSRIQHLPWVADHFSDVRLFVIVNTPWGQSIHGLSSGLLHILRLIDNFRTAKDIYDLMKGKEHCATTATYSLSRFREHIGLLKRIGAIRFQTSE